MKDILILESTLISERLEWMDPIRAFTKLAEERGTLAPEAVVDGTGRLVSDPGYFDNAVVASPDGAELAYCRQPLIERLGHIDGSEWIRMHDISMAFRNGSPYTVDPHVYASVYVGSPNPRPQPPRYDARNLDWSHGGQTIAVAELLPGMSGPEDRTKAIIWQLDVETGQTRDLAHLSDQAGGMPASIRYSPDDRLLLINDWMSGYCGILDVHTGSLGPIPLRTQAIDWAPAYGASSLLAITPAGAGVAELTVFDLATWTTEKVGEIAEPNERVEFRELAIHPDGTRALATAPVGSSATDQEEVRGGVFAAAIIDLQDLTFAPVLPADYRSPNAQRRHEKPRWRVPRTVGSPVVVDEQGLAQVVPLIATEVDPDLDERKFTQQRELCEEIGAAWASDRLPKSELRDEYAAIAVALAKARDGELSRARSQLVKIAGNETKVLRDALDASDPVSALEAATAAPVKPPEPAAPAPRPEKEGLLKRVFRSGSASTPSSERATQGPPAPATIDVRVNGALERLVGSDTVGDTQGAVLQLKQAVPSTERDVWDYLRRAQRTSSPQQAARVALACFNWVEIYTDQFPTLLSDLSRPNPACEVGILRQGFSACLRLPNDDAEVARGVEAGEVMARCSFRLTKPDPESPDAGPPTASSPPPGPAGPGPFSGGDRI